MWKHGRVWLRPQRVGGLSLLLLAALSGAVATGTGYDPETFSAQLITATTLASAQLESLKAQGYRQLLSTSGTTTEASATLTDFPMYRRHTTVAVDTPARGMKHVTVTVSWHDNAHAVQMRLILAE